MGGEFCFVDLAGNGGGDDGGGLLIADVVLNDEHGAYSALFASYDGRKIRIIQFASFNLHTIPLLKTEQTPYRIICKKRSIPFVFSLSIALRGVFYT